MDFGAITVALSSIRDSMGWTQEGLQWVSLAYALPFGGLLLAAGALGDIYGHRQVLLGGLALTCLGALGVALSPSTSALIGARAVQGVGAAAMVPAALALISLGYEQGSERNRALGVYGAVLASGFGIGSALGGLLTSIIGWRVAVLISFGAGVAVLAGARRLLPRQNVQTNRRPRELVAGGLVTIACTAFVYAIARREAAGWLTFSTLSWLVCALVVFAVFVVVEVTAAEPIVPGPIARSTTLLTGSGVAALSGGSVGTAVYFISQYMQDVLRHPASITGLGLGLFGMSAVPGGALFRHLAAGLGLARALAAVTLGTVVALLLLAYAVERQVGALALAATPLLGFGSGSTAVGFTILGTMNIASRYRGVSSGFLIAAQQLGSATVLAALVAFATSGTDSAPSAVGSVDSTRRALLGAAAVSVAILLPIARLRLSRVSDGPCKRSV